MINLAMPVLTHLLPVVRVLAVLVVALIFVISSVMHSVICLVGWRAHASGAQRGADLAYELVLDLADVIHGVTKEIKVPTYTTCSSCSGTGAEGSSVETCGTCNGAGEVRIQQGFFSIQQTCPTCHGQGKNGKKSV